MKKFLTLISIFLLTAVVLTPSVVEADEPVVMVYAPQSSRAITENDVLNYTAIIYMHGYVNVNPYRTQASREDRMTWLQEQATKGFNRDADAFFYSCLLPNSATVESQKTWFGHPITKGRWNYFIQGWFSDGTAAELHFDIPYETRFTR